MSPKPTYGPRGRRSVLPHNFRVARHTTRIALSFQGMRFISATANLFIQMIQMKVAANF